MFVLPTTSHTVLVDTPDRATMMSGATMTTSTTGHRLGTRGESSSVGHFTVGDVFIPVGRGDGEVTAVIVSSPVKSSNIYP